MGDTLAASMTTRDSANATSRRRRARGSLSREEILTAAREIVERDGLRQLSMPTLAKNLSSGVTSIYWYFASKDELVDALAQLVVHDVHEQLPPPGDGPWDAELIAYFVAFHDLLRTLPAYREIVAYAPGSIASATLTRGAQRRLDEGLSLLTQAGLSHQAATDAFAACLNFTRGFVTLEDGVRPASNADDHDEVGQLNQIGEAQYRHGLRLIVAGIRAEL
jgi:AcrR family transcriptional regulator